MGQGEQALVGHNYVRVFGTGQRSGRKAAALFGSAFLLLCTLVGPARSDNSSEGLDRLSKCDRCRNDLQAAPCVGKLAHAARVPARLQWGPSPPCSRAAPALDILRLCNCCFCFALAPSTLRGPPAGRINGRSQAVYRHGGERGGGSSYAGGATIESSVNAHRGLRD
jgi:hypothetical protein